MGEDNEVSLSDVEKAIDESTKKLFEHGGLSLKVEDVSEQADPLLSDKVKEAIKTKVMNLTCLNEDGTIKWVVRYYGVKTNIAEIGVKKMASVLNQAAEKYEILGALCPVIQLNLGGEIATVCYLAFSASDAIKMESDRWVMNEGEIPKTYLETPEDLEWLNEKKD